MNTIITIGRQFGSAGRKSAKNLQRSLVSNAMTKSF